MGWGWLVVAVLFGWAALRLDQQVQGPRPRYARGPHSVGALHLDRGPGGHDAPGRGHRAERETLVQLASRLSRLPLQAQPQTVSVEVAASGDNLIVPASPLYRIRVLAYMLVAAGTVTARWKSGLGTNAALGATGRNLSGPMPMIANSQISTGQPALEAWLFQTDVGQPLVLNLGGAIGVNGHVTYTLETD